MSDFFVRMSYYVPPINDQTFKFFKVKYSRFILKPLRK